MSKEVEGLGIRDTVTGQFASLTLTANGALPVEIVGGSPGGPVNWGSISGTLANQLDLQGALDGKAATSHTHSPADVTGTAVIDTDARLSDARTPLAHSHAESEITNLVTDLAGKASATHTHAQSDVTGLVTALAAKEATANKGVANGYAGLDAGTKVPTAQIPDLSATYAAVGSSTFIGTTAHALNRASGAETIAGLTLTTPNVGAATGTSLAVTGAVTSSGGGIGYATGAGGTVTQATSKSTGVTLSKLCGTITMNAAALAAQTTVAFTLTNTFIAAGDFVAVQHSSAGTLGAYNFAVTPAAGSCVISVRNIHTASLSEAIVLRFFVNKAVTA